MEYKKTSNAIMISCVITAILAGTVPLGFSQTLIETRLTEILAKHGTATGDHIEITTTANSASSILIDSEHPYYDRTIQITFDPTHGKTAKIRREIIFDDLLDLAFITKIENQYQQSNEGLDDRKAFLIFQLLKKLDSPLVNDPLFKTLSQDSTISFNQRSSNVLTLLSVLLIPLVLILCFVVFFGINSRRFFFSKQGVTCFRGARYLWEEWRLLKVRTPANGSVFEGQW